jgi:hypothetical protein
MNLMGEKWLDLLANQVARTRFHMTREIQWDEFLRAAWTDYSFE